MSEDSPNTMCSRIAAVLLIAAVCHVLAGVDTVHVVDHSAASDQDYVNMDVQWSSFLGRSDPVWEWKRSESGGYDTLPTSWDKSAFVGNGNIGAMLFMDSAWDGSTHSLRMELGRTDVYDDRQPGNDYYIGNFVYDQPRLPLGYLNITFPGFEVSDGGMRLVLHDAVVRGDLKGSVGNDRVSVSFELFCYRGDALTEDATASGAGEDVLVFRVITSPPSIQVQPSVSYAVREAISSWQVTTPDPKYRQNPLPEAAFVGVTPPTMVMVQRLLSGKEYGVGWSEERNDSNGEFTCYISITSVVNSGTAARTAAATIHRAAMVGHDTIFAQHSARWHNYYAQSFLSLDDARVESFYWIQQYKLFSATGRGRTLHDLVGPWFVNETSWPDLHWDLNVQMTYSGCFKANRAEICDALFDYMTSHADAFVNNVPEDWRSDSAAAPSGASSLSGLMTCYWDHPASDCLVAPPDITGNLLWTLQLLYQQYTYTTDKSYGQRLVPLLERAVNFYMHFISLDSKTGEYHIPTTYSPEWPAGRAADTNYDLALLRWGLETALELTTEFGCVLAKDSNACAKQQSRWREVIDHLTPYPVDENGFMIASTLPFNTSHRHYSHLFMVFPLRMKYDHDVGLKSVDHWLSLPSELTGFCRPAASSMNALELNRPEAAYSNITFLLDSDFIKKNTMYQEAGGPCGETPPGAAAAVQDWFVDGHNGVIRVFQGIDDSNIKSSSFHNLRVEGGMLVSGQRKEGRVEFIQIKRPSDTLPLDAVPIVLTTDMMNQSTCSHIGCLPEHLQFTCVEGSIHFSLKPGEAALFYLADTRMVRGKTDHPSFTIQPAKPSKKWRLNFWGFK